MIGMIIDQPKCLGSFGAKIPFKHQSKWIDDFMIEILDNGSSNSKWNNQFQVG